MSEQLIGESRRSSTRWKLPRRSLLAPTCLPGARVVNTLNTLAEHLLIHLAYEEESITPTLRTWKQWLFF